MKTQKLFITINALSKPEKRRLSQFLSSPYFNQREDVVKLFEMLQHATRFQTHETMFRHVWPGAPYSIQQIRLLMSYLQKLIDQFLALEQWQSNPVAVQQETTRAYRMKSLERHFLDSFELEKKLIEQQPLRNGDYYGWLGNLLWEDARFNSTKKPENAHYLLRLSENADLFWISQKLRYLCLNSAHSARFSTVQQLSLREELLNLALHEQYMKAPGVATWYHCLNMLEHPDDMQHFSLFKSHLLDYGILFNQDEVRDLFLFAINFCIRQVNQGQTNFFHDILDFYKDGLAKGHIFENGVLSHFTYFNIVAATLHTRDYEWAETFIHQYRNNLERSYRDSAFSFSLARLEFSRKRYDQALSQLQHSNYQDPLLSMAGKTIALKIYYELGEWEVLDAHLEALITFIRRKRSLGYHRNNYHNLARYTRRLIALNHKDRPAVDSLRQAIESEQMLTERDWLLEQLSKIK